MSRLLAFLMVLAIAVACPAQDRHATVELDDGTVLTGRVLTMDLSSLQIQVGHEVVTVAATRMRRCSIEGQDGAPATSPPVAQTPSEPAAVPGEAGSPQEPVVPVGKVETAAPAEAKGAARPRPATRLLPDPIDPDDPASIPLDLRHRSRLRARLEALDEAYPWLAPTVPTQWLSLGLMLLIGLSLTIYLSAKVSGAEAISLGRCTAPSLWYILTGVLQVAMVPTGNLPTVVMLLGNTTMALFWLRGLFDLTRGGAVIAFAVQIGFLVLGYGVLELIDALLKSIGATSAA